MTTSALYLCSACGAVFHAVGMSPKCALCGGRVVITTERMVAASGFTPHQLIEATKRAVEARAAAAKEGNADGD